MKRDIVVGGFYKHFKNKLYQVKCVAYHSETKEPMVVYQAMYGEYQVYVRPYDMFMSEVDHVKYPDVKQLYRFEQVNPKDMTSLESEAKVDAVIDEEKQLTNNASEDIVDNLEESPLEKFLDARGYEDKLEVLVRYKNQFTDGAIEIMAESLEIVVPEGSLASKYDSLRKVLMAHTKYEGGRLRP